MKRYLLIFLLSIPAFGQGYLWQLPNPAPANTVFYICTSPATGNPCSNTASVFSNQALSTPLANPFTSPSGSFSFWAAAGQYTVQAQGPSSQTYTATLGAADPGLSSNGAGTLTLGGVGVGNGTLTWKGSTSGSGSLACTGPTCTTTTMTATGLVISGSAGLGASRLIVQGTAATTNAGCGEGAVTGGASAGKITTSGQTSCTDIITFTPASSNGWQCSFTDLTTAGSAANPHQTATTTTTATWVSGTIVSGDVIQFACIGY